MNLDFSLSRVCGDMRIKRLASLLAYATALIFAHAQDFDALAKALPRADALLVRFCESTNEFTANAKMESFSPDGKPEFSYSMRVAMSGDKIQQEVDVTTMPQMTTEAKAGLRALQLDKIVFIIRYDKQKVWLLFPGVQAYSEFLIPGEVQRDLEVRLRTAKLEKTVLGDEDFDGHKVTKTKVVLRDGNQFVQKANLWCASGLNGFPIKIDIVSTNDPAQYIFRDVQFVKLEASHFEVPTNYVRHASSSETMEYAVKKLKEKSTQRGLR